MDGGECPELRSKGLSLDVARISRRLLTQYDFKVPRLDWVKIVAAMMTTIS